MDSQHAMLKDVESRNVYLKHHPTRMLLVAKLNVYCILEKLF